MKRLFLSEAPDFFCPLDLAKILGISEKGARRLVHREDFPSKRVGKKKIIIAKADFCKWWDEYKEVDK